MRALAPFPGLRAHSSLAVRRSKARERGRVYRAYTGFLGVWGMHTPPGKFRPCESASEAVGGYWSVNSRDSSHCYFLEPLPFESLPQSCLFNLGAADLTALCMQDMKQRFMWRCALRQSSYVRYRVANLRVSHRLSPEGGAWAPLAPLDPPLHRVQSFVASKKLSSQGRSQTSVCQS